MGLRNTEEGVAMVDSEHAKTRLGQPVSIRPVPTTHLEHAAAPDPLPQGAPTERAPRLDRPTPEKPSRYAPAARS